MGIYDRFSTKEALVSELEGLIQSETPEGGEEEFFIRDDDLADLKKRYEAEVKSDSFPIGSAVIRETLE